MTIKQYAILMSKTKSPCAFKVASIEGDDFMLFGLSTFYVYGYLELVNGDVICGHDVKELEHEEVLKCVQIGDDYILLIHHVPGRIYNLGRSC